jgi:hypothetical protein
MAKKIVRIEGLELLELQTFPDQVAAHADQGLDRKPDLGVVRTDQQTEAKTLDLELAVTTRMETAATIRMMMEVRNRTVTNPTMRLKMTRKKKLLPRLKWPKIKTVKFRLRILEALLERKVKIG